MTREKIIGKLLPAGLALAGVVIIGWWWFGSNQTGSLKERIPGADRVDETNFISGTAAQWEAKLVKSNGVPSNLPGSWPRFRGSNLDNISPESVPLAKSWGDGGPKVLWNIDVGEGFAGAAVWNGRVYVMDYDRAGQADALRCLSLDDGREIWRYTYPVKIKRNHGMSRTVPSVNDKLVVAIGPKCQVTCLDPVSGALHWKMDLVKDFNTEVPPWYAGQCPLIDGDRVILAPGGDALVIAVDGLTGKIIWKSPNPNNWQMTHSSLMPLEFRGRRMYVYCASGGVTGISATDGAILWQTPDWKISIANVPSPVPAGDGRIFFCGGYDAGSMMLQLKENGSKPVPQILFKLKPTVFGATQQTPILYRDHLFGVRPDGQLVCLDLNGKSIWESGGKNKFGGGPFLIAQGLIYALNETGTLVLAEADPSGYKPLAQAKVLDGPDAWGPMALAGGRLIARDLNKMVCLEVGAQ
ncbi:MAG: PQQ-like beta-propeller repeat protein [Candidatus Omnitrophica bacterium]|nr:PQQ-like beta-propeller repeat protein [Candidatus Omnitrophota bacterium]